MNDLKQQWQNFCDGRGFVHLAGRTLVRVSGKDRIRFLHSFCSADVNGLDPGEVGEAFVLNEKGKIVAHVFVLNLEDELILSGVAGQAVDLIAHLDKYVIRDDVSFEDLSDTMDSWLLADHPDTVLLPAGIEVPENHHVLKASGFTGFVARGEFFGPGFLLTAEGTTGAAIDDRLDAAGGVACSMDVLETYRVVHGMPAYGTDFDENNLPQEVDRDEAAISFEKGCYLGQETVARIDSLGRVNRLVRKVRFESEVVDRVPIELEVDGKNVGSVTSLARDPDSGHPFGIAMLRRPHISPGTTLESDRGKVVVV